MRRRDYYEVGQWVQSRFRAGWKGTVLEVRERKDSNPLLLVKPLISSKGQTLRKVKPRWLDQHWLMPISRPNPTA